MTIIVGVIWSHVTKTTDSTAFNSVLIKLSSLTFKNSKNCIITMCLYTVFEILRPSKPHRNRFFVYFSRLTGSLRPFVLNSNMFCCYNTVHTGDTVTFMDGTQFKRH